MKTIIIAGSNDQAIDWLQRNNISREEFLRKYMAINKPEQVRGRRGHKVICVGTYWNNPVFRDRDAWNYLKNFVADGEIQFKEEDHEAEQPVQYTEGEEAGTTKASAEAEGPGGTETD